MIGVRVRYLGPTYARGARLVAEAEDRRIVEARHYELSPDEQSQALSSRLARDILGESRLVAKFYERRGGVELATWFVLRSRLGG
jgi:hypothetical protein